MTSSRPPASETIRMMHVDEGAALAQCVHETYGDDYISDHLYKPEKLQDLFERGVMKSCVAVDENGRIVGHLSLTLDSSSARVGEIGQAVVNPACRGRGLFKKMKQFLLDQTKQMGFRGAFSESVTVHPYTQKGNLSLGCYELGLLLGYVPESLAFKDFREGGLECRQAVVLFYMSFQDTRQVVFLSEAYRGISRKIYLRNGLQRTIRQANSADTTSLRQSRIELIVRERWGQAYIHFVEIGQDAVRILTEQMAALIEQGMACIYVDLPLSVESSVRLCEEARDAGFFFGAIIPELTGGDILRMQHLNKVKVNRDEIQVASEFGVELLEFVLSDMKQE